MNCELTTRSEQIENKSYCEKIKILDNKIPLLREGGTPRIGVGCVKSEKKIRKKQVSCWCGN